MGMLLQAEALQKKDLQYLSKFTICRGCGGPVYVGDL